VTNYSIYHCITNRNNFGKLVTKLLATCFLCFTMIATTTAQPPATKVIGDSKDLPFRQLSDDYTVHFTVFPSSFLTAGVAKAYQLTRGKDRALLNLSITNNHSQGLGIAAKLTGTARNLMQQQYQLEFIEIREQDAVYYLAPFRFINEEIMYFDVDIGIDGQKHRLEFMKKLYVD
jgi:hypothetical protein